MHNIHNFSSIFHKAITGLYYQCEMFVFRVIVFRARCALIPVLLGHSETIAGRNVNVTTLPPATTRPGGASVPPDTGESWYVMRGHL